MNTVMSKRLYAVCKDRLEVKLSGNTFYCRIHPPLEDQTETNFILGRNVCKEFNYFCFNKHNRITCWPTAQGAQPLNEQGQWKLEGRQELKPGRFFMLFRPYASMYNFAGDKIDGLDTVLDERIFARACEVFTDRIRGVNEELNYTISRNIAEVYGIQAHEQSGYLQNSCMRNGSGYSCSAYAEMYDHIPQCSILHQIVNGQLLYRALLWTDAEVEGRDERVTFLDRVYGSEATIQKLRDVAEEKGWAWRSFTDSTIRLRGDRVYLRVPFPQQALDYASEEGTPYVDTLYRIEKDKKGEKWLTNGWDSMQTLWTLQECSGEGIALWGRCCSCERNFRSSEEIIEVNGDEYCEDCARDRFSMCDECGEWVDGLVDTDEGEMCEDCAITRGYRKCRHCGEWLKEEKLKETAYGWYCKKCYKGVFVKCDKCGEKERRDRMKVVTVDGVEREVCRGCYDEMNRTRCRNCGAVYTDTIEGWQTTCRCTARKEEGELTRRIEKQLITSQDLELPLGLPPRPARIDTIRWGEMTYRIFYNAANVPYEAREVTT